MEIYNHFTLNKNRHPIAWNHIRVFGIECECIDDLCVVDISENNPQWCKLSQILKSDNISYSSQTKFDKNELSSSEWLTVRSRWYYDYPQPENEYTKITYIKDDICSNSDCGIGKNQNDLFRFKRTPKWGKRNFCMTNWVYDELFVSEEARRLMENSDLKGFSFLKVKNKNGKEFLSDIYQLMIPCILQEGIADLSSRIDEIYVCPKCGKQKFRSNNRGKFVFKKEAFINAPDFVKSAEWFGGGAGASKLILVSQKAYRFITENKLDSSLVFEPISLV